MRRIEPDIVDVEASGPVPSGHADLLAHAEALRLIADEASTAAAIVDAEGRICFANAGLRRRFGPDCVSTKLSSWAAPDERTRMEAALAGLEADDPRCMLNLQFGGHPHTDLLTVRAHGFGATSEGHFLRTCILLEPATDSPLRGVLARALHELDERSPVLYASIDTTGKVISASPLLLDRLGYDAGQMIGHQALSFDMRPDRRTREPEILQRLIRNGGARDVRMDLRAADGERVRFLVTLTVENDRHGQPATATAIFHDISAQVLAQRELEKNQSLLESINRNITEGIFRSTPKDGLCYANPAMLEMFGFATMEDFLACDPSGLYADPSQREKIMEHEAEHGCVRGVPVEFKRLDGGHFWGLMSSTPSVDAAGNTTHFDGAIIDITAQRETLAELQESRQRLSAHMVHSPLACVETDNEGRITDWNPVAEGLFGRNRSAAIGHRIEDVVMAEGDRDFMTNVRKKLAKEGRGSCSILENQHSDGTQITCEWHNTPLKNESGEITHMLWLAQDISRRLRSESELKRYASDLERTKSRLEAQAAQLGTTVAELEIARKRAEMATRAKDEFLANMSHEIRTPMNGVIGMASLLLETRLDSEQSELVRTIERSGDSLLHIINDILDYSKVEAGQIELESTTISPRLLLEDSLEVLASRAAEKNIELVARIDPAVPDWVRGDPTRLRQILVNLLSNAVKFTSEGEVVASLYGHTLEDGQIELQYTVRDTGIGIAPETLDRLFDPFTQGDASTTRRFGGTGLGLSISRRLAELMGGDIKAESAEGQGSVFTVHLRTALSEAPEDVEPAFSLGDALRGTRIAVVQENAAARTSLCDRLRHLGAEVAELASGTEAILFLTGSRTVDLWMVDSGLDDMPAGRLLDELYSRDANYRILLMTTIAERVDDKRISGRLVRPLREQTLHRALAEALQDRSVQTTEPESIEVPTPGRDQCPMLVVEDNAVNLEVLQHMLKRLGYEADYVTDGQQALDAFQDCDYGLVLMDVQMPVLDGLEATRRIRELYADRRQPTIIAVTANAMRGDRERCLEAGMDGYLAKPISLAELRECIADVRETRLNPQDPSPVA